MQQGRGAKWRIRQPLAALGRAIRRLRQALIRLVLILGRPPHDHV